MNRPRIQPLAHLPPIRRLRGGASLSRQLAAALQAAIQAGAVAPRGQLPSSRTLARATGVSRNTVLRAYDMLSRAGVITTARGAGTFAPSAARLAAAVAGVTRRTGVEPPWLASVLTEARVPTHAAAFRDPDGHPLQVFDSAAEIVSAREARARRS
jgi:DNA-binding transcriptional MocR family regulator